MSSSTKKEVRPIYVWPKGADLAPLKAAVLELGLPFSVKPYWYEPGAHPRAIALGDGFNFIADYARPKSHNSIKASVEWFFGLRDLPQAHTIEKTMERIFGEGAREVEEDPWGTTNPVIATEQGYVWP